MIQRDNEDSIDRIDPLMGNRTRDQILDLRQIQNVCAHVCRVFVYTYGQLSPFNVFASEHHSFIPNYWS